MMFLFILLFLFIKSSLGLIASQTSFTSDQSAFQLLGNTSLRLVSSTSTTTLYNHHVAILLYDTSSTVFQICSGELITTSLVITSASCVIRATSLKVIAGLSTLTTINAANTFIGSQIITHLKFERNTKKYDIALIRLASSVTLSSSISTVALPYTGYKDNKDFEYQTLRVLGFSLTADSADYTTAARAYADMTALSAGSCYYTLKGSKFYHDSSTISCFSSNDIGGAATGACKGDLGGGILSGGLLVGIVSDYRRCGETTFFTRIGPQLSWIKQYI